MSIQIVPINLKHKNWGYEYQINYRIDNLKFIHIGKCGGTAINQHFFNSGIHIEEYHLIKPKLSNVDYYFSWIRNPIKRFVSAFNHSKNILDFEIKNCDAENLNLDNCPAPAKILSRIRTGIAFEDGYDKLVQTFENANELAESLSSSNKILKDKAKCLMNHPEEHIFKGIGWYLHNGLFIEKFQKQISLIGRLEHMNDDFKKLSVLLGIQQSFKNQNVKPSRVGNKDLPVYLSKVAVKNIRDFYSDTDYKALNILKSKGFISEDTIEEYNEYEI